MHRMRRGEVAPWSEAQFKITSLSARENGPQTEKDRGPRGSRLGTAARGRSPLTGSVPIAPKVVMKHSFLARRLNF